MWIFDLFGSFGTFLNMVDIYRSGKINYVRVGADSMMSMYTIYYRLYPIMMQYLLCTVYQFCLFYKIKFLKNKKTFMNHLFEDSPLDIEIQTEPVIEELEPEPTPEPVIEELEPEPTPEPVPEPTPAAEPEPESKPAPEPVPEPTPAPEPVPESTPAPEPVPEPTPAAEPEPVPKPKPE